MELLVEKEHDVSDVGNPAPWTWMVASTWAEDGVSVIDAEDTTTCKLAEAMSPALSPVAVTLYDPPGRLAISKEPVKEPPETKQVGEGLDATAVPLRLQVLSPPLNPYPVTSTVTPGSPDDRLNAMTAPSPMIVKVAEAESPMGWPTAMTV